MTPFTEVVLVFSMFSQIIPNWLSEVRECPGEVVQVVSIHGQVSSVSYLDVVIEGSRATYTVDEDVIFADGFESCPVVMPYVGPGY